MCSFVLFHVVFASKGLVARGAADVFLASVLFAMAGGVAGCGEGVGAFILFGMWARILLFGGTGRVRVGCVVGVVGFFGGTGSGGRGG